MTKRNPKGQFLKGVSGNPGGLPEGARQKASEIKEMFFQGFDAIGGLKGLTTWAGKNDANRREFYSLLVRQLPKEIDVEADLTSCDKCIYPRHTYQFVDMLKSETKKADKKIETEPKQKPAKKTKASKLKAKTNKDKQIQTSKQVKSRKPTIESRAKKQTGGWRCL